MPIKKQTYFTREELKNFVFQVQKYEHLIFMPNEIFNELINGNTHEDSSWVAGFYDKEGEKIEEFKSSIHIAYAYSYVYLSHFMYRYCKYRYSTNERGQYMGDAPIDEKLIKKILGIKPKSMAYTYITKKGGILENLGYIRKERDAPTRVIQAEKVKGIWEVVEFVMESEYPEIYVIPKNRQINYPVKGFYRDIVSEIDCYYDGTFYSIENTHQIDIDVFIYCMCDKELGVTGFYLYCFMLYKYKMFEQGFDCSLEELSRLTGLGMKTVRNQLFNLERRNMISCDHKPFCVDKPEHENTKSNTYKVKPYNLFHFHESLYNTIPKQRKINAEQYAKEIGFVNQNNLVDNMAIELPTGLMNSKKPS